MQKAQLAANVVEADLDQCIVLAFEPLVGRQMYAFGFAAAINAPKPLNPALVSKSQQFLGKNTWYSGPQSADPDSKVLTALDSSLTAEGWDPTSDAYWVELETRAKKYLPHRMAEAAPRANRRPRSNNCNRLDV